MVPRKRSLSDMAGDRPEDSNPIDEDAYRKKVLRLADDETEEIIDKQLTDEALALRLLPPPTSNVVSIDNLTASLSATTVSSDPNNLSSTQSRLSQSTDPTSCSSSDRRPVTQASHVSEKSPTHSVTPSISSNSLEKKPRFGLKDSFLRISGFRKRKSKLGTTPPALRNINGNTVTKPEGCDNADEIDGKPSPIHSLDGPHGTAWSTPSVKESETKAISPTTTYSDHGSQSSLERTELKAMRASQMAERDRFIVFEDESFTSLRKQQQLIKDAMLDKHVESQKEKRDRVSHEITISGIVLTKLSAECD